MLKRLPIALPQVEVNNTSENLLNKIRQIVFSLYYSKEITKKKYQQHNKFNTDIMQKGCNIHKYQNSKILILIVYYLVFQIK